MTEDSPLPPAEPSWLLRCPECGNTDRFIEIMEIETHLVDGHRNYLQLLDAITDHYLCVECGERIEADGSVADE